MKLNFLLLLPLGISACSALAQVNGYKEDIQGIPAVHVWGSDYEMGYAIGYLDGDKFATIMEDIIIPSWGEAVWEQERDCFAAYFTVPPRIDDMVDGMIAGMGDHPDSILFSPSMGRNYDDLDLHVGHSLTDITAILYGNSYRACTSLSAWDSATASDPELQGAPILARNLDSEYHPLLAELQCIITINPDQGNQVVLFGHPLDFDCSTAMNEYGICVTRNAAYHDFISSYSPLFVPIGYSALMGLMTDDFDGSGANDLEDLLSALTEWNRAPSKNLHVGSPRILGYMGEPAIVVEINNDSGYAFRVADDDPVLAPDHMAATNHFRILYSPDYCSRYQLLTDSLTSDPDITADRIWDLMGCCDIIGWYTYLTVVFQPESREIGISFCDSLEESWAKDPVWLTWDILFQPEGVESGTGNGVPRMWISPNPSSGPFSIEFQLECPSQVGLAIFDIAGRLVRKYPQEMYSSGSHSIAIEDFQAGVYYCRLASGEHMESVRAVVLD